LGGRTGSGCANGKEQRAGVGWGGCRSQKWGVSKAAARPNRNNSKEKRAGDATQERDWPPTQRELIPRGVKELVTVELKGKNRRNRIIPDDDTSETRRGLIKE